MDRAARLGGFACFVILSVGIAGLGFSRAVREQANLVWVYVGGALLAFMVGFVAMETIISNVQRDFQMEIGKEEKRSGHSLSKQEISRVGADFRAKRERGESNVRFPLQRLFFRIILLLPAIFVAGFLVTIGTFLTGFFFSGLIAEYQKRTISYF